MHSKSSESSNSLCDIQHTHDVTVLEPLSRYLAVQNLSYAYKKNTIVKNINFILKPGDILAVIGPSGAGKSTLLRCLAHRGNLRNRTGKIFIDNQVAHKSTMQSQSIYISDQEHFLSYLTVYETLFFTSKLKYPLLTNIQHKSHVQQVIKKLRLAECVNTIVGDEWRRGLSTGERRRLSLAIGLISQPSIIIADEPTTGLDSSIAYDLLLAFKQLAAEGRILIFTIHQASSQIWSVLDKILLLSKGQTYYFGPSSKAKDYFAQFNYNCPHNCNPADFFSQILLTSHTLQPQKSTKSKFDREELIEPAGAKNDSTAFSKFTESKREQKAKIYHASDDSYDLHEKYESSESYQRLLKDLDEITQKSSICSTEIAVKDTQTRRKRRSYFKKKQTFWFYNTFLIAKHIFTNLKRNPIALIIICLVQALQGLILGSIFWQLRSDVRHDKPLEFDFHKIVTHPVSDLFINGFDGRQPLLELFEKGVDQNGSQPLFELFQDYNWLINANNIALCGLPKVNKLSMYDTFSVRPTYLSPPIPPAHVKEDLTPPHVLGALIGVLQIMDFVYMREDWSNLDNYWNDSSTFYTLLSFNQGRYMIMPWLDCAGYPTLIYNESSTKKLNNRRLIALDDINFDLAYNDILGLRGADIVATTSQFYQKLKSCTHISCQWLYNKTTTYINFGDRTVAAFMVATNIISALFIAIVNAGFVSFEVLLTFPQQRLLIHQGVDNQLYKLSQFYVGKIIAELPFQLLPNLITSSIFYFMVGLSFTFSQFIMYCVITSMIAYSTSGFGYIISAATPRIEIAIFIAPVILVLWILTVGFFIRDANIPKWIRWISYLGFPKWGYSALILNQFTDSRFLGILPNPVCKILAGIPNITLELALLYLLGLGMIYRLFAFFFLKYSNRPKF